MTVNTIAVYGTLRTNNTRFQGTMTNKGVIRLPDIRIENSVLIHLGGFPTIMFINKSWEYLKAQGFVAHDCVEHVIAEMYDITEVEGYGDKFRQRALDRIESYPNMYTLALASYMDEDKQKQVPVYTLVKSTHMDWLCDSQLVVSGDWDDRELTMPISHKLMEHLSNGRVINKLLRPRTPKRNRPSLYGDTAIETAPRFRAEGGIEAAVAAGGLSDALPPAPRPYHFTSSRLERGRLRNTDSDDAEDIIESMDEHDDTGGEEMTDEHL